RSVDAAHHLGDERDPIVLEDGAEVVREDPVGRGEVSLLLQVTDERPRDTQPVAGGALDLAPALDEEPVDRGADGPVAEERDRDVDARHQTSAPRRPCLPASARSSAPTCSSCPPAALRRASSNRGRPASSSANSSRAKAPLRSSARSSASVSV